MKEFHSCFGEGAIQVSLSSSSNRSSSAAQNLVTSVYHYQSRAFNGFITVTWIKHLMAQGLNIGIENSAKESLCKVDIKPWLFSKRKGIKNLFFNSTEVEIQWDLSSAKFGSGPEPLEGFYLAIALNQEPCLLLGDLPYKKTRTPSVISKAILVAKREHIFGKRLYSSKAQFCDKGKQHDIRIEYDPNEGFGKCLMIYVDKRVVLEVTHLKWKFRGNETIMVDGVSVEVYWDVHSWLFGSVLDNAIFLFRTSVSGENKPRCNRVISMEPSALRGAEWEISRDKDLIGHGFSLVLCVWRNE